MEASLSELTQIAFVVLVAVALGLLLVRLRQPPIVGYILTGIVLGPTALGMVSQTDDIRLLAEMGVLLLLFLIGMELSLRAFILVLRPAVLTAVLQIAAALCVTFVFGYFAGWSLQASILLGFAVAISSTALVVKMLEDVGELRSEMGRITVGVLIAQDLAIIPILLFSESLGQGAEIGAWLFGKMAIAIAVLFALIWALGRPGRLVIPFAERLAGKPDLLTLAMLAVCLAGASLSGLFGLSPIYGAFVAGLVIGQSNLRAQAISATHPVQSLLIVVFFLSIGLMIDLEFLAENWLLLILFVIGIIATKSVMNVAILHLVGEPWERAFPAGLIMAQIGEFSFVIAAAGLSANVIDYSAYQAAIAVIAVSLLISPFWLVTVRRFHDVAEKGIANFREALHEVYEDELAEIGKGAAGVRRAARAVRMWGEAVRRATKKEANASATAKSRDEVSGAGEPATAMAGSGQENDAGREDRARDAGGRVSDSPQKPPEPPTPSAPASQTAWDQKTQERAGTPSADADDAKASSRSSESSSQDEADKDESVQRPAENDGNDTPGSRQ